MQTIDYRDERYLPFDQLVSLYRANEWSAADKPELLHNALLNSHTLISAWQGNHLIGVGNAISDGHLVVYYPHLLVHPDLHGQGIGSELMKRLMKPYAGFHQQMLVADGKSMEFYGKMGFERAGNTASMWVYAGEDH